MKQKDRLKNFDAIITISETSKKDIIRFLDVEPDKVKVIYLAQRSQFRKLPLLSSEMKMVSKKYNLPEKFVLYVGDVNYNKNIPTLIDSCEIANIPLVIVGKQAQEIEKLGINDIRNIKGPRDYLRYFFDLPHPELLHYREVTRKFGKNVLRLGFVNDEELVAIYNLASVYCQPSYYEGFGFPVLEAMACGCPVVSSKTSALVEISGNASLYANPKNKNEFAAQFNKILSDKNLKSKLIEAGFENVKKYSWEKTAKETVNVYKSLKT